ncbi:hypothetical protein EW145_g1607 [Phellinidium pouzarii]|uniref:Enolase C-terminal domain-containing protein n=1 Tax=Phellinidium pouzarii TaxID=167371 RepID=A0A4S4LDX0_9AGAM|nr:hypothetical protein EW145_g1607 [Phellinidium pouzarii]
MGKNDSKHEGPWKKVDNKDIEFYKREDDIYVARSMLVNDVRAANLNLERAIELVEIKLKARVEEIKTRLDMTGRSRPRPWFIEESTAPDDVLEHATLLQAKAVDVVQIDSCRLAGVSEVLSVLLMAAKFGVPVCPHAGGVVSGSMERNVLEFVDHLHEHFLHPCSINAQGRYNVPSSPEEGYSIEMYKTSIAEYEWPNGSYWAGALKSKQQ